MRLKPSHCLICTSSAVHLGHLSKVMITEITSNQSYFTHMKLFRKSRLKFMTNLLVMLLVVTFAARSQANCMTVAPQTVAANGSMEYCTEKTYQTGSGMNSTHNHQPDRNRGSQCNLNCPVMMPIVGASDVQAKAFSATYLLERQPPMTGIPNVS